jgi:hypothetical protein
MVSRVGISEEIGIYEGGDAPGAGALALVDGPAVGL